LLHPNTIKQKAKGKKIFMVQINTSTASKLLIIFRRTNFTP